jgi:hypothetical protein
MAGSHSLGRAQSLFLPSAPGAFIGHNVIEPDSTPSSARAATCAGGIFGPLRGRSHLSVDETRVDTDYLSSLFAKFDSGSVRDRKGCVLRACISSVEGG